MKDLAWKLFTKTGNIGYYQLYKDLENGRDDACRGTESDGLQGK